MQAHTDVSAGKGEASKRTHIKVGIRAVGDKSVKSGAQAERDKCESRRKVYKYNDENT